MVSLLGMIVAHDRKDCKEERIFQKWRVIFYTGTNCASMLLSMGFTLKDVQEWLGHSDIKMTANVYSHLDNGRKSSIAAMLVQNVG